SEVIVTETIDISTTICPVTATETPAASTPIYSTVPVANVSTPVYTPVASSAIVGVSSVPAISSSTPVASSPAVVSTPAASSAAVTGEATYYGGNLEGGTCSFSGYTLPSNILGTALSGQNWDTAANCGACLAVTGPSGNSITVMVVDECPECAENGLDLFEGAFTDLAAAANGTIDISWEVVECGITDPLVLRNKEGTSEYWFSIQVMNSNVPVEKLEVSVDGGSSWTEATRTEYNYFENSSGFGAETMEVRVTSTTGSTIVVSSVGVTASAQYTATSNF
ncbi:carbohydrate-binding module family 63 protein, partial [Saccharata proteae CBS 121410]